MYKAIQADPSKRFQLVDDFRKAFSQETGLNAERIRAATALIASLARNESVVATGKPPGIGGFSDSVDLLTGKMNSTAAPVDFSPTMTLDMMDETVALTAPRPSGTQAMSREGSPETPKQVDTSGRSTDGPETETPTATAIHAEPRTRRTWGKIAVAVAIIVALVAGFVIAKLVYKSAGYRPGQVLNHIEVEDRNWTDTARNRQISVRLYYPQAGRGPFPTLIFSPGLGGSKKTAAYLGKHWAGRGYISVHIQHPKTGVPSENQAEGLLENLGRLLPDRSGFLARVEDVRFVLDHLQLVNSRDVSLSGRLDLDRIGMAGNFLGAVTTLALAGQTMLTPEGAEENFQEQRIKAAIVMNPFIIPRQRLAAQNAFSNISIPMLHFLGTKDIKPLGEFLLEEKRTPFERISGPEQYMVTFTIEDFSIFSRKHASGDREGEAIHHRLVANISAAFWDAYLKGDPKAVRWLKGNGVETALDGNGTIERKPR